MMELDRPCADRSDFGRLVKGTLAVSTVHRKVGLRKNDASGAVVRLVGCGVKFTGDEVLMYLGRILDAAFLSLDKSLDG